jgi:hypothetical protein
MESGELQSSCLNSDQEWINFSDSQRKYRISWVSGQVRTKERDGADKK